MGRRQIRIRRAQIPHRCGGHGGNARRAQKCQDRRSFHHSSANRFGVARTRMEGLHRQGLDDVVGIETRRSAGDFEVRRRQRVRQHPIRRTENARWNLRHRSQSRRHDLGRSQRHYPRSRLERPRALRARGSFLRYARMRILQVVADRSIRRHGISPTGIRRRSGCPGRTGRRRSHRDASRKSRREGGVHQSRERNDVGTQRARSEVHRRWMGGEQVWVGCGQVFGGSGGDGGDARWTQKSQDCYSLDDGCDGVED
mmetsp:Transcript_30340/g.62417  ORF Transcript_30340/g.62417 Transcript_30340/m.62417 type:complete len:256 (+) Transcript_30340:176-943(+)